MATPASPRTIAALKKKELGILIENTRNKGLPYGYRYMDRKNEVHESYADTKMHLQQQLMGVKAAVVIMIRGGEGFQIETEDIIAGTPTFNIATNKFDE